MGAINYRNSDYITLGIKPFDYDDYTNENDETDWESFNEDMEFWERQIENVLYKYDFSNFKITIEPGYYEGFTLDLEYLSVWYYQDYEDKQEALKEATKLKACLRECVENGLVECFPGWCPGYNTKEGTLKSIDKAIKQIKSEIKATPTEYTYDRMHKSA